jgi:hypothetical protein
MPPLETEQTTSSPTAGAIREKLLDGLVAVDVFASAMQRTPRQILFWITQGLPITRIGKTPYVKVDAAREWLQQAWSQAPNHPRPNEDAERR